MLPAKQLEAVIVALHDIGAVRFGDFKLHSGRHSPIYLDLRLLTAFPSALRQVAALYIAILETIDFDLLAAMPLAGLPIGTVVSLEMDRPLVYPRQALKGYGTGKRVEGAWLPGQRVAAIDDLITSGDSLLQGIAVLEEVGLRVPLAVVLIDRQQGGRQTLLDQGYRLYSAFNLSQMLATLARTGRITTQQRDEVRQALRI